jgi:putative CocE/NonD family hydrolase
MSQAEYDVHLASDVLVPMRDGIQLAADLYLPAQNGAPLPGGWPSILIRTPYNKTALDLGHRWATHGYACLIQDCRGRYNSEGTFYKYVNEAQDGYDTVEWMAQQAWCNGKVGTTGISYLCHVQTFMAALNPPHLRAMFCIKGGFYNAHTCGIRQGGALEFRQVVWAFRQASLSQEARRSPSIQKAFEETDLADWLTRYPFKRGYSPVSPAPAYEAYLFDQIQNSDYGDFWKQVGLNTEEYLDDYADVPTVYLCGWYDIYARSAIDFYQNLSRAKRSPVRLIMGPWEHSSEGQVAGEVDFGLDARLAGNIDADRFTLERRWFDRWLKGAQNGAEDDPPIRYFTMGGGDGHRTSEGHMYHGGVWHTANAWPPSKTQQTSLYLQADNGLTTETPEDAAGASAYRHDPRHPVPTLGGNMIRYENILWPGAYDQVERPDFFLCKPPCLPLATRHDVLVFRTSPLEQDVEVTGTVVAHLYVSSSAPDTDFTVKLIDEYPPHEDYPRGFAMNVTHGIIRCRYRDSKTKAALMEPGQVYQVEITCYPTSNLFQKGHRIRVDIASSNYPHFDLNPNTGAPLGRDQRTAIAENAVYHSREYLSHIVLPTISSRGHPEEG